MTRGLSTAHRVARAAATAAALAVAAVVLTASPAAAEPSCVARSVQTEHEVYGTAWGHEVIAYWATNRAALQEYGFDNWGEYVSYVADQESACPA